MCTFRADRGLGLILTALLAAFAGCSDDAPPIGLVSGTITHAGKPVPNLTVNFVPNEGRPSWGITDADGYYELHWDIDHDGAQIGTHRVFVVFDPTSVNEEVDRARGKELREERSAILDKYGSFETTPLADIQVKDGSQEIDLKLD